MPKIVYSSVEIEIDIDIECDCGKEVNIPYIPIASVCKCGAVYSCDIGSSEKSFEIVALISKNNKIFKECLIEGIYA